jgi:cobalamin biosynthesis Mg chelatase CobN
VAPAPAAPTAAAAPTASATARTTATPSPSATAARTTAVAASATPSRSDSGPTAESNWNKPIDKPEKASHAAAVSAGDDGPGGYLGVFAIMGGVLLVGFAGLVFALWSRNRLAGHW